MPEPDGDEVRADQNVGASVELGEQARDARIVRRLDRLIPAARPVVDRRRDESNGARVRRRPGNHVSGKRVTEPVRSNELQTERARAPAELERENVVELVAPPTVAPPRQIGDGGPRP